MNEVTITNNQTPIEIALKIDESGHTTARALYEFLEMDKSNFSRWAGKNIEQNEFFTENEDWWGFVIVTNGNECKDYKLTTDFAKHLCMESHSSKGKIARQYFITVEDKAKEMVVNRSQLSPYMQMFYAIADGQAKLELEQKRQAEQIEKVEATVTTMKEIFTEPIGDWKNDINARVREISIKSGIDYQELYGQMYGELEMTAHCSLKRLQDNKRTRMEKAGNTKTAIKEGTTKIAIIYEKPQLKAIFENIVKRYAMKYCAWKEAGMDELANIDSIFTRELLQKFNLIVDKEDIKKHIRELADNDNCFDNLVFELGCESLAEYCCKEMRKI